MTKTTAEFITGFLDELSREGLIHGTPAQYRRGYPSASDEEIQLLFDAGKKAGTAPYNLAHARLIMSDNVSFIPAPASASEAIKQSAACDHWPVPDKRFFPTVGVLVMARTMQSFAAQRPDAPPDLMPYAIALEKRALDAIEAGVAELMVDAGSPEKIEPGSPDLSKMPDHLDVAIAERLPPGKIDKSTVRFCSWNSCPAVLVDRRSAFAVMSPGAPWKEVDATDVYNTAAEMLETRWRNWCFNQGYGTLNLSAIRDPSASSAHRPPTPKDFDDAALAVQAADRELKLKLQATLGLALSVLGER